MNPQHATLIPSVHPEGNDCAICSELRHLSMCESDKADVGVCVPTLWVDDRVIAYVDPGPAVAVDGWYCLKHGGSLR